MKRASASEQRAALSFKIGERVKIERVAFPDVAHHAVFMGALGTVQRVIKTQCEVVVMTDALGLRYCHPANLSRA